MVWSAVDLLGGWEWAGTAVGMAFTVLGTFWRKWKWVLIVAGLAAIAIAFLVLLLNSARKDTTIARLEGEVLRAKAESQRHQENWQACQAANATWPETVARLQASAAADLEAVSRNYERRLAAARETIKAKEEIREAAKVCVGSAAPYRAVVDRVRRERAAAAKGTRDAARDPPPAAGPALPLRPGAVAPAR